MILYSLIKERRYHLLFYMKRIFLKTIKCVLKKFVFCLKIFETKNKLNGNHDAKRYFKLLCNARRSITSVYHRESNPLHKAQTQSKAYLKDKISVLRNVAMLFEKLVTVNAKDIERA